MNCRQPAAMRSRAANSGRPGDLVQLFECSSAFSSNIHNPCDWDITNPICCGMFYDAVQDVAHFLIDWLFRIV